LEMEKTSIKTKKYDILKELRKRFVYSFLDIIVLAKLISGDCNGYALIKYIYQRDKILVGSGSLYSTLYAMERKGLIKGEWIERSRIYHITPEGKEAIQTVAEKIDYLKSLFSYLQPIDKEHRQKSVFNEPPFHASYLHQAPEKVT